MDKTEAKAIIRELFKGSTPSMDGSATIAIPAYDNKPGKHSVKIAPSVNQALWVLIGDSDG